MIMFLQYKLTRAIVQQALRVTPVWSKALLYVDVNDATAKLRQNANPEPLVKEERARVDT